MITEEEFGSLVAEYEGFRDTILDEMAKLREELENLREDLKELRRTIVTESTSSNKQTSLHP